MGSGGGWPRREWGRWGNKCVDGRDWPRYNEELSPGASSSSPSSSSGARNGQLAMGGGGGRAGFHERKEEENREALRVPGLPVHLPGDPPPVARLSRPRGALQVPGGHGDNPGLPGLRDHMAQGGPHCPGDSAAFRGGGGGHVGRDRPQGGAPASTGTGCTAARGGSS